jgi:processing peptidase subunit alpha
MLSTLRSTLVRQHVRMAHISAAPPRQKSVLQSIFGRSAYDETPLNAATSQQSLPTEYAAESKVAKLTTLDNGLRVVSLDSDKASAHLGVHVDAGSRYEDASTSGLSHFLELHSYKSTSNRSALRFTSEMEKLGVNVGAVATREQTSFSADALRDHLPHALGGIADTLANQEFFAHELPRSVDLYKEMYAEPNAANPNLFEGIHAAAYKNNTYGHPLYATSQGVDSITTEALVNYTSQFWTPERTVVSAVGVSHNALVDMCNEMFGAHTNGAPVDKAAPVYTGGDVRLPSNDGLTHVTLGFQAPDWHSADVIPLLVLQSLMGGGGAFSAGGPGKGMLTRLYRNVLNGHPWVINSKCDAHVYNDAGIFTISGDCLPQDTENLVGLLVKETLAMAGPVSDVELSRAKNQLKSAILLALESRQVKQQDMGQQVLTYGNVTDSAAWIAKIEAVTAADLQRVAGSLFASPLSLATSGDVLRVPNYSNIQSFFSR